MLQTYLKQYFGYSSFRPGQKEIISEILKGNDVLGVLPTGSGKSICYQLPAKIVKGTVLVISPLIALMVDQVKQLIASGFKEVIAINSFLDFQDRLDVLSNLKKYKLIYISPEMLQNKRVLDKLKEVEISLFVIDEAHCISQWGHEFRPDYLKLREVILALNHPTVLALSATATPEVQDDIIKQLNTTTMSKLIFSMDRDNIAFKVANFDNVSEKISYLVQVLKQFPVPTMVYFSSRNWTEKVASELSTRIPSLSCAYYHGGMEQSERLLIQQQFMNGQLDVICCTSAFGMGINKNDVRLVVHFHLPTQMESFIQEVGRAGRDGESSVSLVLTAPNDDYIPRNLIESEYPTSEQLEGITKYMYQNKELSIDSEWLRERFQLSETQWRFLQYQLEKHGMIENSRLIGDDDELDKVVKQIQSFVMIRRRHKHEKFMELKKWVHTDEACRRKELFISFQDEIKPSKFLCCDYCDFSFDKWDPIYSKKNHPDKMWRERLDELFFRGASQ